MKKLLVGLFVFSFLFIGFQVHAENVSTPSITVTSPNGGETYSAGQQINVTWSSLGIPTSDNTFEVILHAYNSSGIIGSSYNLELNTLNDGQAIVTLPTNLGGASFGNNFVMAVGTHNTNYSEPIYDYSDTTFTITDVTNGGCSNGEVYSSTTGQKCPIVPYCTDSDGGYDEYKKGTLDWLTLDAGLLNNVDSCTAETTQPTTITEYGCVNQQSYSKVLTCPYGCSNGACINKVITDNGCSNGAIYSSTTGQRCINTNIDSAIYVDYPNNGEVFLAGDQITVKWTSKNLSSFQQIFIALHKDGGWSDVVYLSKSTLNDGAEVFTLPSTLSGQYRVRIGSSDAKISQGWSNLSITINPRKVTCPANMPNPYAMCSDGNMVPDNYDSNGCITSYKCSNNTVDTSSGCSFGAIYSFTTGARCSSYVTKVDGGCNGINKYSLMTGKLCGNYTGVYTPMILNTIDIPITRTLKLGIKGDDVKALQAFLNLLADGSFGPKTQAKVMEWQAAHGLTADGSFGRMSRQKAGLTQ